MPTNGGSRLTQPKVLPAGKLCTAILPSLTRLGGKLGGQEVVVGVKQLRHVAGRGALCAAGQGKVQVDARQAQALQGEARRGWGEGGRERGNSAGCSLRTGGEAFSGQGNGNLGESRAACSAAC